MTPAEVDLVQASFAKVKPISQAAARLFYGRLFETTPEVKPLFRNDMDEQGRKLMVTFGVVINGLKDLDAILPAVRELAVKHKDYGVTAAHYEPVGQALIWTLENGLGDDFTPDIRKAWIAAYGALSGVMIEAAYGEGAGRH